MSTVDQGLDEAPHLRQQRLRARTVDERHLVVDRLHRAGLEGRVERRRRVLLHAVDLRLGALRLDRAGDPGREAAAAERDENQVRVRKVLEDLEPDRPVPGHHLLVLDRMEEEPVNTFQTGLLERLPPLVERLLDDVGAEPLHRRDLRLGRVVRNDHRARHPELLRRPGHALAHVPGARRDQSGAHQLGVGPARRVVGAAQLEGPDRLDGLELEEDLGG